MAAQNYHFTVQGRNSLLDAAGRQRGSETDHVVELQLVVAALNMLPSTTYSREGWETDLVDFFHQVLNLQSLPRDENLEKGQAVTKFLREGSDYLDEEEEKWIRSIRQHWSEIRHHLTNFVRFKDALDAMLGVE